MSMAFVETLNQRAEVLYVQQCSKRSHGVLLLVCKELCVQQIFMQSFGNSCKKKFIYLSNTCRDTK